MRIDSDSWQAQARKMRAKGKTADEIAAELGQAPEAVREALRWTRQDDPPAVFGAGATLIEPHVRRVPRTILDRQALPAAAAAFASGEIDRAELMRRIAPTPCARL
jgi:hypothetical protein